MCQSNHDEASQFFYVVTKAADIALNLSTATTENSDSISSSTNTFSYLHKPSDYPTSSLSTTGNLPATGNNLNSSSYNQNNSNINNNNKKNAASKNQPERSFIVPEDLVLLIQDVVDSHPGLGFLKEATEFHSRYVHTVSYNKSSHISLKI